MYRYLAWMWDTADLEANAFAVVLKQRLETDSPWVSVIQASGLHVWHAPTGTSGTYLLSDHQGVVLGTLFRRVEGRSFAASRHFSESHSREVIASAGRALVDGYWGRYVAFLRGSLDGSRWVLRDPTGGLPCYQLIERGVHVFFLDLEDVLRLGVRRDTPDWDYLERAVCVVSGLQHRQTGLVGVSQILGGEVFEYSPPKQTQVRRVWNPVHIAQHSIEDTSRAESELRQTTNEVIHAWARQCPRILLALSGGLDSSIVAECLASAPDKPSVVAFDYHSEGASSDERRYARLSASRAGFRLSEVERRPSWDVRALLEGARCAPSPGNHVSFIEPAFVEDALAEDAGAQVIVTGFGGDQLFLQDRPQATADYARRFGLRPSLWRTAMDEARMEGVSVWSVLKEVVKLHRLADMNVHLDSNSALLNPHILEAARQYGRETESVFAMRIGRGKAFQIQQLLYPPPLHNPLSPISSPEIVSPLFSQPLVEICLRIPTYLHTRGGDPRALARYAFRDTLPAEIVNRWGKGGYEEQVAALFEHNRKYLRDLLLNGELLRRHVIDRARLEEWFSRRPTRLNVRYSEVWNYVFYEALASAVKAR